MKFEKAVESIRSEGVEVVAALRDACQEIYQKATESRTTDHDDWCKTMLPGISIAVSSRVGLGDEDSVWQAIHPESFMPFLDNLDFADDQALTVTQKTRYEDKTWALEE